MSSSPTQTRIFVTDDHDVVREGLVAILTREPDLTVVGHSATAEQALAHLARSECDVVIVDQRLPGMNGIEMCREIAEQRISTRVVILSAFLDQTAVESAFLAGASGYVVKDVDADELKRAIRAVARGEWLIDPKIGGTFTNRAMGGSARASGLKPHLLELLRLLVSGMPIAKISETTGLSGVTVQSYLRKLYRQLGASGRAEAVSKAVRRGIV